MSLKVVKMPKFVQRFYPEQIWAFPHEKDSVYLTFDDGPIPEVTPWVLDELNKHNAKATFFCIGENIQKHPDIFRRIISEGHAVGNHTFNHLNGWKTKTSEYVANVEKVERQMEDAGGRMTEDSRLLNSEIINRQASIVNHKSLFRPPYGKITSKQAEILQKKGFHIVMWDILSYDYDATVSEEKCLQNVLKNLNPGSVVVFHDSLKAAKNLRYVLPKVLEFAREKNWSCKPLALES